MNTMETIEKLAV